MTSPLAQLSVMRLRLFFREPGAVFWSFGFPLLLSIVLGIAFRDKPPEAVRILVQDGPDADSLASALGKSVDLKVERAGASEADRRLRAGKVALIVVPGSPVTYRFDTTRPDSRLARALTDDAVQRSRGRQDVATVRNQPVTEPGSRYVDFLIPGLIGMNLMSAGMWGIGYVVVENRTKKLLKRLMATPMRKRDFLVSLLLMRLVFLLVELPVMLVFARLVFDVQMQGSLLTFTAVATLGALAFAALGLLVATRAQNTQTVSGLINLVMMPMFLCSGVFFSSANFPDVIQPLIQALPLTALNDALRAIQNEGAGLQAVSGQLAVLAVTTVVSGVAALKWFRWT